MALEVGQNIGDYQILDVLGKGGMGRVYRVRHVISNRIEAMKVLLADLAADPELGDRFGAEIRTLARLDNPNIAKLHTALKVENQLVMVMEFVEGFTLSDRARQGPIPLNQVLSYTTQTLAALSYAHANGVIHRDIKPSNIMITSHGVVKLMDFGIAKTNTDTMHTRAGTTVGSMLYMSPEQVRGTTVDARSDLYSLGVVLYELTAGRPPFKSDATYAVLDAQLNAKPQPPVELNPSLPKPLNEIILTALEKEPTCRFQTADAFRKALESLQTSNLAAAQPAPANVASARPAFAPPSISPTPHPSGRNRGIWMALGALACVLVLIAAAIALPHFWRSRAATHATPVPAQSAGNQVPSAAVITPQPIATSTAPITQPAPVAPAQNQSVKTVTPPVNQPVAATEPKKPIAKGNQPEIAQTNNSQPGANTTASQTPVQNPVPQGPSQEEIDKVQESLMQMHSRADAIHASVNSLRRQQAADGLEISPEIAGAATRLDEYLQAADRASQNNDLAAARKYMDGAEKQVSFLEAKFGR